MFTFVGRTTELHQLNNLLQEARQKRGSVVLLSGEAGIGKSALVEYFLAKYATDVQVFHSKCSEQYGEGSAFLPWIEILTDIISDKDPEGKPIPSKLLAVVKDTLGPWVGVVPVIGNIIAAIWETGKSVKTHFGDKDESTKDRYSRDDFCKSFVTTLQKVGELSPTILFIDDLQWSDTSSIGLLRWLTDKIATLPVLIIGVYRPSDVNVGRGSQPLSLKDAIFEMHNRYHLWTILDLDTLSRDLVNEYLTITFSENLFTPTFVEFLYDITNGSPFFLEQYLQLLKEEQHLKQLDGKWQLVCDLSVIQNEVPRDVQGVIQKRLDRLQDEILKDVLLYGSAEGEEFTSFVLSKLMSWESQPTIERLNLLTRIKKQLVETHRFLLESGTIALPKSKKATKYQFAHTVLYKVLYNGLNDEQRTLLHQSIGDCLEAEFEGREEEIAEKLAEHFFACGEIKKAVRYTTLVAVKSKRALAPLETERNFAKAYEYIQRLSDFEEKNDLIVDFCITAAKNINDSDTWHTSKLSIPYCQEGLTLIENLEESLANLARKIDLLIQLGRAMLSPGVILRDITLPDDFSPVPEVGGWMFSDKIFEYCLKLAKPIEHIIKGRILNYWIDTSGGSAHASGQDLPYSALIPELVAWCEDHVDIAVAKLGLESFNINPRDSRWETVVWKDIEEFNTRITSSPQYSIIKDSIKGIEADYKSWKTLVWDFMGAGLYEEYRFYKTPQALKELTSDPTESFYRLEHFLYIKGPGEIGPGFDRLISKIEGAVKEIERVFEAETPYEVKALTHLTQLSLY